MPQVKSSAKHSNVTANGHGCNTSALSRSENEGIALLFVQDLDGVGRMHTGTSSCLWKYGFGSYCRSPRVTKVMAQAFSEAPTGICAFDLHEGEDRPYVG